MLAGDCFIVILPQSNIFFLFVFFPVPSGNGKVYLFYYKKQLAFLLSLSKAMTYFG